MIAVRYLCGCMVAEAVVQVRDRRPDEGVVDWVESVMGAALAEDHRRRSPTCRSTQTEYVKIPAPENAPFIGGAPVLNS